MEMCYDGALVLPSSYAVMNEEEMTYVEGGIYFSNETLCNVASAVFCATAFDPIGAVLVGLGVNKAYKMLRAGVAKIGFKLGKYSWVLGAAITLLGFATIGEIGVTFIEALMQGKGIDIGIKTFWFGLPYGLEASIC